MLNPQVAGAVGDFYGMPAYNSSNPYANMQVSVQKIIQGTSYMQTLLGRKLRTTILDLPQWKIFWQDKLPQQVLSL
jgi:hypothetical protein